MENLLLLAILSLSTPFVLAQNATQAAARQETAVANAANKQGQSSQGKWRVSKAGAEQLRKELTACDAMKNQERKDCRREVFAARNDNLYGTD